MEKRKMMMMCYVAIVIVIIISCSLSYIYNDEDKIFVSGVAVVPDASSNVDRGSTKITTDIKIDNDGNGNYNPPDSKTMLDILLSLPTPPISFKSIDSPEQEKIVRDIWNERQEMIRHAMETIENRFKTLTKLSESIKLSCLSENNTEFDSILQDLLNLEDIVSGLDDAQDFIKVLNGTDLLLKVISKKSLPDNIRSTAAHALGSAIKSFVDLQEISRLSGTIQVISSILKNERDNIEEELLSKLLYLIGSQIRNHIPSQEDAKVNNDFIQSIVYLFRKATASINNITLKSSEKKIINFIIDIFEQQEPTSPLLPSLFSQICDITRMNVSLNPTQNDILKPVANRCNVGLL